MGAWLILLGGLLTWAAHFFSLYAFASLFPASDLARWLTVAATLAALAIDAGLIWRAMRVLRNGDPDPFRCWTWRLSLAGAILSFIAVSWQGIPALA